MRRQAGFTLLEIAIVMVIIGVLLGAVLKGQELITGARVRDLISVQDGLKGAFFGFQDRFRAYPGDYPAATTNINGATVNGNGNAQIELLAGGVAEHVAAWEHLARAGFFISGSYTYNAVPGPNTGPTNPYAIAMQIVYDNAYADPTAAPGNKHNLKTGNQIPADIIAEVDRKIDDGNARQGSFRFSVYTHPGGTAPLPGNCHNAGVWILNAGTIEPNCGGASLL